MFVVIKKKVGTGCRETIQIWTKANFYPRQDVLEYCSLRCEDFEAGFWSKFKSIWIHFPITPNSKSRSWDASYLKTIWFWEQKKNKFYTIFCFIIISHIQLKFIGKENPIWAGEDLIKKFCFQIELVWRQDIRTAQNINNKGWDSLMTETCQNPI